MSVESNSGGAVTNTVAVPKPRETDQIGRVVPQSIEAEACVLGVMILDAQAIDMVMQTLKGDNFHRPAHQIIFDTLLEMRDNSKPIDLVTLREELERQKLIDKIGGVEYIVELADGVPSLSNIEHYANIVRDKAMLRKLIRATGEITTNAYDSSRPACDIIEDAE